MSRNKAELDKLNKEIYDELMWILGGPDAIKPDKQVLFGDHEEIDCPKSFTNLYPQKLKVFLGYRSAEIVCENGDKYYANLLSFPCPRTMSDFSKPMRITNITEIGYKKTEN